MSMGHDHHGHSHGPSADADRKWLTVALALIAGFMVVEVVVGIIASSLALLSDAAHMLTDAIALGLSLLAIRLAARPSGGEAIRCTASQAMIPARTSSVAPLICAERISARPRP